MDNYILSIELLIKKGNFFTKVLVGENLFVFLKLQKTVISLFSLFFKFDKKKL